jgi:adenosylhomocysteine nucleosidase
MPSYQALIEEYNPLLVVLLGIGGSIHNDARTCDVVVADSIWYYDKRAEGVRGTQHRGLSYNVEPWLCNEINRWFNEHGDKPTFPASEGSYSDRFLLAFGPIGTGEAVIKHRDAEERQWLHTANDKVLAVDTEAGGVAYAFWEERLKYGIKTEGYLIFRGVSDHADQNKHDGWRVPAATNAMSALRILLERLPAGLVGCLPRGK